MVSCAAGVRLSGCSGAAAPGKLFTEWKLVGSGKLVGRLLAG